eukprot:s450_g11.t1
MMWDAENAAGPSCETFRGAVGQGAFGCRGHLRKNVDGYMGGKATYPDSLKDLRPTSVNAAAIYLTPEKAGSTEKWVVAQRFLAPEATWKLRKKRAAFCTWCSLNCCAHSIECVLLKREPAGNQSPLDNCGADGRFIPWSCDDLSDRAGDARAMVSAIPYGSDFGLDASLETPMTLRQFLAAASPPPAVKRQRREGVQVVNAPPPYFFVAVDQELQPELAETLETSLGLSAGSQLPWPLGAVQTGQKLPFRATTLQFAVGAEGSGSPMHFHQDALNLCLHGRKRWWLVPPSEAAFSRWHPSDALETGPSAKSVKDCFEGACVFEQEEGDIVYVPDMWGHAVLNLEDHTVCVAAEFA